MNFDYDYTSYLNFDHDYTLYLIPIAATRFGTCLDQIHALIGANQTHIHLELQQRSVEFSRVINAGDLKSVFV